MQKYSKFPEYFSMTLDEDILRLVDAHELSEQSELLRLLRECGHAVTQPTLSRHLKKLGVQKMTGRYQRVEPSPIERPGYTIVEAEPNLVVIITRPGYAQALAVMLDQNRPAHVAGTLAGDDTVLVVVKPPSQLATVAKDVERLLSGEGQN
jgi:transcriptional regulator of arginine metabolism